MAYNTSKVSSRSSKSQPHQLSHQKIMGVSRDFKRDRKTPPLKCNFYSSPRPVRESTNIMIASDGSPVVAVSLTYVVPMSNINPQVLVNSADRNT